MAKFLVEPSYRAYSGSFDSKEDKGSFTAQTFALNLGYTGEYFLAGLWLEKGNFSFDDGLTSDNYNNYSGGGVGTFLGFHFFDRWKVWSAYQNSSIEPQDNNDLRYFGQFVSFGVGYRIYGGFIFNVEGFRNQYTQQENDTTGKTSGLDRNIKTQGTSYSISYLMSF